MAPVKDRNAWKDHGCRKGASYEILQPGFGGPYYFLYGKYPGLFKNWNAIRLDSGAGTAVRGS